MLCHALWYKFTDISDVPAVSIIRVMTPALRWNTSEILINFYQTTWFNIPGDSHLLKITADGKMQNKETGKKSQNKRKFLTICCASTATTQILPIIHNSGIHM
jgi:hypothetical protein